MKGKRNSKYAGNREENGAREDFEFVINLYMKHFLTANVLIKNLTSFMEHLWPTIYYRFPVTLWTLNIKRNFHYISRGWVIVLYTYSKTEMLSISNKNINNGVLCQNAFIHFFSLECLLILINTFKRLFFLSHWTCVSSLWEAII